MAGDRSDAGPDAGPDAAGDVEELRAIVGQLRTNLEARGRSGLVLRENVCGEVRH